MPPQVRREVPDDGEAPSGIRRRSGPRDEVPRAWTPNLVDPADHPIAMGIATTLAVLAGICALVVLLLILVAIDARTEPEGTPGLVAVLFSVPVAVAMAVFAGTAAIVYAWCGATRRAVLLGVVAGTGVVLLCGLLALTG